MSSTVAFTSTLYTGSSAEARAALSDGSGVLDLDGEYASQAHVRRPLRGIEMREPSYGQLCVSGDLLYTSSAKPEGGGTTGRASWVADLLVQTVSISSSEKFQAVPTFGAPFGYFFGTQHEFANIGAVLLDTADFEWKRDWWANYNKMRGTALVERGARVLLAVNGWVLEGYLISTGTTESAGDEGQVQLQFTMWVVNRIYDGAAGSVLLPRNASGAVTPILTIPAQVFPEAAAADALTGLRGVLARISGAVDAVRTAYADLMEGVEDFLYARDLVIPVGYSDAVSVMGPQEYNRYLNALDVRSIPLPWHTQMRALAEAAQGYTWENWDEYVQNPPNNPNLDPFRGTTEGQVNAWLGADTAGLVQEEVLNRIQAEFSQLVGPANWSRYDGYRTSEVTLRLGRMAFGALNVGASLSGADTAAQQVFGGYSATEAHANVVSSADIRNSLSEQTSGPVRTGVVWPE